MAILRRVPLLLAAVVATGLGIGVFATELAERTGLLGGLGSRAGTDNPAARQKREQEAAALLATGDARKAANDMKGALEAYTSALKLLPGDADLLFRVAQVRMAQGDYKGATADLDGALKLRPRDAGLLFTRGSARAALGMSREALGDLSGAIAAMPGHAPFHVARADVLESLGRKAEAQQDRKRAAELK